MLVNFHFWRNDIKEVRSDKKKSKRTKYMFRIIYR